MTKIKLPGITWPFIKGSVSALNSNGSSHGVRCISVIVVMAICAFAAGDVGFAGSKPSTHMKWQQSVLVDMHAHPGRFHRENVPRIQAAEISLYRKQQIDVVVCCVSADAVYRGGYVNSEGTRIERKKGRKAYMLRLGEAYAFSEERIERILKTAEDGDGVLAVNPAAVLEAKRHGRLALLPALEGADALERKIENLEKLYRKGLRLLQLVHFRNNEIGFKQTRPHRFEGLTPFGENVTRECNRLGIIIDLAHANTHTTMDVLAISKHPVIVSHTGAKAILNTDRHLDDDEIRAIAAGGGIIGVWPNGQKIPFMSDMIQHIDHIRKLVGVDHIGIGSDLRGLKRYTAEFSRQANFGAIAAALIEQGYTESEVGRIMGGNFFALWEKVSRD